MYRTVHWLFDTKNYKDQPMSSHPLLIHIKNRSKEFTQKKNTNPQSSANKMAAEENVNSKTMQDIIKEDYDFHPYHKRKFQGLTAVLII